MDEQNKQPEQNKPEKKLSRTTLTFYIVGLFSVAIALILISYVAQSRADKQVENLSSQLTQQQTVAQGATQKVEDLQKQYDMQNTALDKVRKTLDNEQAATDVVGATERRMEEREVYQYLAQIGVSLAAKQTADARKTYDEMLTKYSEERLLGSSEDGFDENISKLFQSAKATLEQAEQAQDAEPNDTAE
ncbi:hypothetical protein [Butyricicoccus sp.]